MKKNILFLLVLCPLFMKSQSVEWIVHPNYDYVKPIQYDFVKVKNNGKVGIISNTGSVVVEPVYDSITDFHEGMALVVDKKCRQLKGIVDGATKIMHIIDGYEIDENFPYFSDGMLAVKNVNGKWGFLNKNLEECPGYLSCRNESVLPFSEGVTFIKIDPKNHAYFDLNGNPLIGDFGKVVEGYSFNNGEAFVFLKNTSWAWIDLKGNVLRCVNTPKQKSYPIKNGRTIIHNNNMFEFDIQWCMVKSNIDGVDSVYEHHVDADEYHKFISNVVSVIDNGLYYEKNEIVPKQFDDIVVLSNECVAASVDGKYGILRILSNQAFSTALNTEDIVFYHATPRKVSYDISIPKHIKDNNVDIVIRDENNANVEFSVMQKNNMTNVNFYVYPEDGKLNRETSEEFYITLSHNKIKYFEDSFSISKIQKSGYSISCPHNIIYADSLGYANCNIIIRNNTNDKSKPTEIIVSCDDEKQFKTKVFNQNESITIPVRVNAVMSDDYINKSIYISLKEDGYPEISTKKTLKVFRYIPEENNN